MNSIMGQIKPEHPDLFALEFEKNAESDVVYTLTYTNITQSAPKLIKMYVIIRSRMSSIMDLMGLELSKLFALEFAKIDESDFVYMLASTNINQSAPNLVKMFVIIRSRMSMIIGLIGPELSKLSAHELVICHILLCLHSSICKY